MQRQMKRLLTCAAVSGLLGLGAIGCAGHARATALNPTGAPTLMLDYEQPAGGVGVLDRTELLVGYFKSGRHEERLSRLRAARDGAREAGREAEAEAIEAFGAESQEIAHRQLAREEPLYTVLLGVEPELRELMRTHGLSRVVEKGPGVEGVDITAELVGVLRDRE